MPIALCVDDEPDILLALRRTFRNEPFQVLTTTDPSLALDILRKEVVDVLLVDQRMPRMRGTDLLRLAKDLSPDTSRVLLTAYPEDALIVESRGLFTFALVGKPWEDEKLRALVRSSRLSPR